MRAAAIVHYASVRDGAGSYIMPDTLRYDEENKKTILVDTPFEWNNPISFDTRAGQRERSRYAARLAAGGLGHGLHPDGL